MWTFYVNRGQAISSFGIANKDSAISEFLPADKAYQQTPLQGFRTFLKIKRNGQIHTFEPFSDKSKTTKETMTLGMNYLELSYEDVKENISIHIKYCSLPQAPIGALVRNVRVTNNGTTPLDMEVADGLANLLPAGVSNTAYKEISNTLKSWFDVKKANPNFNFYYLRGSTEDTEDVNQPNEGNFYTSLVKSDGKTIPAKIIYDQQLIFGHDESLRQPRHFIETDMLEVMDQPQVSTNRVSAGFTLWEGQLKNGKSIELMTLVGYGKDEATITTYLDQHFNEDTINKAFLTAETLTKDLTDVVDTNTANSKFDQYVRQSYLDNGLRGGFPTLHKCGDKETAFYVYSRKHGDLERDYNFFSTSPTYYSQGNGNYRDMNQNRRMDVFFTPEVKDTNIHRFIELIQLDGYNPLVIKKVYFDYMFDKVTIANYLVDESQTDLLRTFFNSNFEPGTLLIYLEENRILLNTPFEVFLAQILCNSSQNLEADHGEGFWIDHWTYNMDLIDTYLAIYPDKEDQLLFDRSYKYYRNKANVQTRKQKYFKTEQGMRQYNAVELNNEEKSQWITFADKSLLTTNLFSKLFLLAAVKAATIAPFGYGISMEAGKPGWNDSLNGLPGLFGASTPELFELKRLLQFLETVDTSSGTVVLPIEGVDFLNTLTKHLLSIEEDNQSFWDTTTNILEDYRRRIYNRLSGEMTEIKEENQKRMLKVLIDRVEQAINNVEDYQGKNLIPTYFYFEKLDEEFKPHAVTPFLEGYVKKLRVTQKDLEVKNIYQTVKESDIFDKELKMYKTSGSLNNEPIELGRTRFFTPGWLENESVFLHMSYKYLLELLKKGLYHEFYQDSQTMLIPNLEPERYGRSTLENSSFIASSANPDPSIHGRGFVARLSGSTVEFLNMWVEMFIGSHPFGWNEHNRELSFQLKPVLHNSFFKEDGTLRFNLFGSIKVTYQNEKKKDTYGKKGVKPIRYHLFYLDGQEKIIEASSLNNQEAQDVRAKLVEKLHVVLA